jgi:hypothetical protein
MRGPGQSCVVQFVHRVLRGRRGGKVTHPIRLITRWNIAQRVYLYMEEKVLSVCQNKSLLDLAAVY